MNFTIVLVVVVLVLAVGIGMSQHKPKMTLASQSKDRAEGFYEREGKKFAAMKQELQRLGRVPVGSEHDRFQAEFELGNYDWHSNGNGGWFGAYSYYLPAVEQAKKCWWTHGSMEGGSDILFAENPNAKFDPSVVGYHVDYIYINDKQTIREAVVVEFIDARRVRLNVKAVANGETWNIGIKPPSYRNLSDAEVGISNKKFLRKIGR